MTGPARLWELTSKKGWVRTECDLRLWIPCPVGFPEGMDRDSWAADCARLRLEEAGVRKPDAVQALASMLAMIHRDIYADVPCHQIWIYLPEVTALPLPVCVGIWELHGDRDDQLRALSGARDPGNVRPPFTEPFTASSLGEGYRTMRYKRLEDGRLYGALGYAFRSEAYETDVQVWASTPNLSQLQAAVPDIDALIRGMTVFSAEDLALAGRAEPASGPAVQDPGGEAGGAVTAVSGLLRIAALRWLAAELIPFGCLVGGLALAREVRPAAAVGYVLALIVGTPLTIFYLYKVLGSAVGWVWAIAPLMIGSTFIGGILFVNPVVYDSQHPNGTKVVVTGTWWIVVAALAVVLALAVAAAIANGERWIARNAGNLPRNKFEKYARSRGTLARLWLTR